MHIFYKTCLVLCLLFNSAIAAEEQPSLESPNLFGVFIGQKESAAITILETKSTPQIYKMPCASEWIATMKPPLDMGTATHGSCVKSAISETQPKDGEVKIYTVEFVEQYETEPGVAEVSLVEYGHYWDSNRISQEFDPFELALQRFGPATEQYDDMAFWDYFIEGARIRVVFKVDDLNFKPKYSYADSGYLIKIMGDHRDHLNDAMREYILDEQAKLKNAGSKPDF